MFHSVRLLISFEVMYFLVRQPYDTKWKTTKAELKQMKEK